MERSVQLRPHFSVLIRRSHPRILQVISAGDPKSWPTCIQSAFVILSKRNLPDQQARTILYQAAMAGCECARSMNARMRGAEEAERSRKVKKAVGRLSLSVARSPARVRRVLDMRVAELFRTKDVDSEAIESLFQITREAFAQDVECEEAERVLRALGGIHQAYGSTTIKLATDFSSLAPRMQDSCKCSLLQLVNDAGQITAAAAYGALAGGLSSYPRPPRGASDIVIQYVADLVSIWRSNGLRSGRAFNFLDPAYTSNFHRFCDLVLTAIIEPDSRRHDHRMDQFSRKLRGRQSELPPDVRKYLQQGLSQKDRKWLVTPHCLREGLRLAERLADSKI
jgi:hypothetical protein